jgi:hypothetical protein
MMFVKRMLALVVLTSTLIVAQSAQAEEANRYGSLWLGPHVGAALGFSGPRGGYLVGLELSYRTPYYFYYNIEIDFLHLLPRTITVEETVDQESETVLAPEHEATVTGLYGIPITMEIGLRLTLGRAQLRAGVGFGAMVSIQNLEAFGSDETEVITSFCFRPGIGVDIERRSGGLLRFDLMYLWQDADFQSTGSDRDVDSLSLTFGYSWQLARE